MNDEISGCFGAKVNGSTRQTEYDTSSNHPTVSTHGSRTHRPNLRTSTRNLPHSLYTTPSFITNTTR